MKTPLIDVIVPVYNVETYLPKCMENLLEQDFEDYVITLVDDGSTDACPALCDRYAAEHPGRVRVLHQANSGPSVARNNAVACSEAAYIAFVDADDYMSGSYLSALYAAMIDYGADMVQSAVSRAFLQPGGGVRLQPYPTAEEQVMDRDRALEEYCRERSVGGCPWGKLLRRETALACPFPAGRYFEDSFAVWRQIMACDKIAYAASAVYYYVQREGSIQRRRFEPRHMDLIDAVAEMMEVFRAQGASTAVMNAGSYKVCRSCYVTAYHAADLPYGQFRSVCGRVLPLLRRHLPAAKTSGCLTGKDLVLFRLLLVSRPLFYAAVRLHS